MVKWLAKSRRREHSSLRTRRSRREHQPTTLVHTRLTASKFSCPTPIPYFPAPATEYLSPEVFVVQPFKQRYWLHILLLLATVFTTLVVGAKMEYDFIHNITPFVHGDEFIPLFPVGWALQEPSRLLLGIPFSATLLLILLAHEMGHYLYCRYYGVYATLPFFIPAPTLIGTLGRGNSHTFTNSFTMRAV